jgi:hypothetical protein
MKGRPVGGEGRPQQKGRAAEGPRGGGRREGGMSDGDGL